MEGKYITGILLILKVVLMTEVHGQVTIKGIRLTRNGQEEDFMNIGGEDRRYLMECLYEAEESDITNITWSLENYGDVYSWTHSLPVSVNTPLLGNVEPMDPTTATQTSPNIEFVTPDLTMRGVYTCKVYHKREDMMVNPVVYEYFLNMYALVHEQYGMNAILENCTAYWNFSTPAMAPKPEVTCGYWNTTSGVMAQDLPGGLVYHMAQNYTWYAFMTDIPVEIETIPRGTVLFCRTDMSLTNYTQRTEIPKDLANKLLYDAIDDQGCPAIPLIDENMSVELLECQQNCRGECHQIGISPVIAEFVCNDGYLAYWEINDTVTYHWRLKVTCDNNQHTWSSEGGRPTSTLELPYCIYNRCEGLVASALLTGMLVLLHLLTNSFSKL